jgi:hypothetical protein
VNIPAADYIFFARCISFGWQIGWWIDWGDYESCAIAFTKQKRTHTNVSTPSNVILFFISFSFHTHIQYKILTKEVASLFVVIYPLVMYHLSLFYLAVTYFGMMGYSQWLLTTEVGMVEEWVDTVADMVDMVVVTGWAATEAMEWAAMEATEWVATEDMVVDMVAMEWATVDTDVAMVVTEEAWVKICMYWSCDDLD